jgi:hypothetical protein
MMTRNLTLKAVLSALVLSSLAFGQYNNSSCTNESTIGTYAVSCAGFITPAANAPSLPFTILGTVSGDKDGNFSGLATTSVEGAVFPQAVAGQANTKPDCTGSITYNKGQKDEINIKYVIVFNGDELKGIVVDRGANVSCTLQRMKP